MSGYDQRYMVKQFLGTIRGPRCFFNCYNTGAGGWVLLRAALPLPPWDVTPWPRTDCTPPVYETGMEVAYLRKRFKRGVLPRG